MQVDPIGVVRTPYRSKYDAPRQPNIDDRVDDAIVELRPHQNFEQALRDLDGFSHIWLITWFDRAEHWKPLVLPPRSAVKRGVFATRSPHRPNPIGISVVRLMGVDGRNVHVRGTDLLDGTPVLDIKPYVDYADRVDTDRRGWVDTEALVPSFDVTWHCPKPDAAVVAHVERVLALDPWPHPYRRTKSVDGGMYELAVRTHRIRYRINERSVDVLDWKP